MWSRICIMGGTLIGIAMIVLGIHVSSARQLWNRAESGANVRGGICYGSTLVTAGCPVLSEWDCGPCKDKICTKADARHSWNKNIKRQHVLAYAGLTSWTFSTSYCYENWICWEDCIPAGEQFVCDTAQTALVEGVTESIPVGDFCIIASNSKSRGSDRVLVAAMNGAFFDAFNAR